ncbi:MAG TPA: SDR family oxidoreductase [Pseudomonadales bacterium]|nr:SDR family oxidoreductase [Pseudomonadales bacterium]
MSSAKRTILVTGAASGICKATAERLRGQGHRVISADLNGADIEADLGTAAGRSHMIERARELAPHGLDAVLAGAGIGNPAMPREIVTVNYFGALATLEGLQPLLARGHKPRAVLIASTAAFLPVDDRLVELCLAGDETAAVARAVASPERAYPSSKHAIARWLRKACIQPQWAGAGILLNAIGPGVIETPMTGDMLRDPHWAETIRQMNPRALREFGKAEEVAELLDFLLNFEGSQLLGQIIYIDGGNDAVVRGELV